MWKRREREGNDQKQKGEMSQLHASLLFARPSFSLELLNNSSSLTGQQFRPGPCTVHLFVHYIYSMPPEAPDSIIESSSTNQINAIITKQLPIPDSPGYLHSDDFDFREKRSSGIWGPATLSTITIDTMHRFQASNFLFVRKVTRKNTTFIDAVPQILEIFRARPRA